MKIKHIILFAFIALASCKTSTKKDTSAPVEENVTSITTEDGLNLSTDTKAILKMDNTSVAIFNTNPVQVSINNQKFLCKDKGEKHKFYNDGSIAYEVKFKGEKLKLRNKDSKLLWKMKIYPDKVKISDNEENENPYIVRNREGNTKIEHGDKEVYRVKYENSVIIINDKPTYTIQNGTPDKYVYGVLAIEEIPMEQRVIILAELLRKI